MITSSPPVCRAAYTPHISKVAPDGCISIIGMAAAGKTTIGRELSALIAWPQIDVDHVIESTYGMELQALCNVTGKEEFLDIEGEIISRLDVRRCIVSTGGSAVYRADAIRHLKRFGPVMYIEVSLPVILERIARKPERGLAIAPGQTVEDLYNERVRLYETAADFTVAGGREPASTYAKIMARWLAEPA